MTILENLGSNHDLIRYSEIDGVEKLLYSKDGTDKSIIIFKGSWIDEEGVEHVTERSLFDTIDTFEKFLNKEGVTRKKLGSSDNGAFKINILGNNVYSVSLSSDPSVTLQFYDPVQPITPSFITDIQFLISNFLDPVNGAYQKYLEFFKKIAKDEGFLVKIGSDYDWMMVKTETDSEIFIPKSSGEDYWFRAYFSKKVDNHSIDLSFKEYKIESDHDLGIYESYESIAKNALVELELEDKRVVYLDLFDGVDLDNGIVVRDMNISSQKVIKNIRIYYEIDKSSEY